ncbi:hypothetical protein [Ruminiclostridium cellulolyticum]|uniref:Uncharacterized protein n=1 Tax=Ruminiclostridium cellulolyticum (strain ATCC 35319 / DSM 5812 / JCM 6584 / H10) TaxID=394503 RepID=B8I8S6_RUMCH|nr:hypothetical protein [Ruminiclostridium cellulolyticum]ACL77258.1 conserved hypothetical protein [Ruminiclostridium cellulolyticum H10]
MDQLQPIIFYLLKYYTYYDEDNFRELYVKNDLKGMFFAIHKRDVIQAYKDVFQYLPDDIKYKAFFNVYTRAEYNFKALTIKILDALKKLRPDSVIQELSKYADDKGYITIYRGECTKSTPVNKALSWSLDKDRAEWFARRFLFGDNVGYVYSAKVKINDVIGYYNGRDESEVIVRYKYLMLISSDEFKIA